MPDSSHFGIVGESWNASGPGRSATGFWLKKITKGLPAPNVNLDLLMFMLRSSALANKKPTKRSGEVFLTALLCAGLSLIGTPSSGSAASPPHHELDRIAYAVDGAESSHGANPAMWRPNSAGPQGPMQVSDKAARDVGGGDRYDVAHNRALGRAYLALLYRR